MKIRIKYFDGAEELEKISKGNWIDVYSRTNVFIREGESAMVPLGFALELPPGWEGHLAPRSSTFKKWGVIQTNHVGVIDDTYIGDNDEWHMPIYCLEGKDTNSEVSSVNLEDGYGNPVATYPTMVDVRGTWIYRGDKIGQFRVMETMPELEFEIVSAFGNDDRGGFGTTGSR